MGIDSTAEDYDLSLHTLSLEREYDQTVSTAAQLLDQEARRVHRVDQLLQQFENENLQQQLDQARQEIGRVRSAELEILGRLNQVALERDRIQQTVYVLGHEKENLARELESMSDTSVEVKTLMTEKMRLAKELAGVQTEVQRLQSVESSSQTLLAEKQALSRQLSSLEMELENERRAHERTRSARGGSEQQQQQQQQQLQQQLQKQQQQQQAATAKWNAEKAALEDKIETLTKKLLATKDQLRKAQINNSNSSSSIQQQQPLQAGTSIVPVKWSREQSSTDRYAAAARINPELTIATPGAVRAKNAEREKRAAAVAALPGEKSAFSITPFLNRTTGAPSAEADSNENHADNANNDSDQESSSLEDSIIREPDVPGPTTAAAAAQRPRQLSLGLGKARPEKTIAATTTTTATAGNSRRPRQASRRLDPIDDDDDDDIFGAGNVSMLAKPQVRKRKLGGQQKKLIIDEEDDDMDFDFRKAGTARGRGFGGVPAFSPLKRDRR
ncbi:uncharacterized protein BO95DRAFT_438190 [Aspergillus brunneoviolaceus CBS 621.78]|uniref:Uncharacterized protein n=1 Tax=Aspergillus brunneoviolaceus CBS 621.78 TaxID=1450534 RepID=A0ACD1GNW0_9EURO|nr:hypothetical protein BO95DRAFT_438190 [Aspergillus brunneoviolaceus CBS 621.78]RAH50922.1 hypothetical protein BO95DRAFT_438190 [Aspergillus brunneoviolaceus CBS 621.78]